MNIKKNTSITTSTQHPDYVQEILSIIRSTMAPRLMKEKLGDFHENDIATAIELSKKDERRKLYSILDNQTLADVLEYSEQRNHYINEMGLRKRADILSCLEVTTAAEYLQQLEKPQRTILIDLLDDDLKKEIAISSSFDKDEIGSRMTTNYISIRTGITVRQAMKELVEQAADNDNISTIYVLDADDTFLGAIDLKDLIIARESTSLDSIIMTSYPYVYASELIEDCIERIRDYSEDSIPVLDENNRLVGVLTAPDIVDLVNDALGEDYAKLAGLSSGEDLQEPLKKSIGKRLPWLAVLLGLGMVVSSVVGLFEAVVAHLTLIVCFQSLVLDMAGNVGTQSLAVTIRVLMDEHLTGKQKLYLISKETRVGLLNGLILGVLSFAFIGLYLIVLKGQSVTTAFAISGCTGVALLISMVISSIVGTAIPISLKKMKIDPAVASGPLITTINDLVAVVSYYGLAWILLINILHL